MLEENGRLYHGYNGAKYVLPNDEVRNGISNYARTS